MKPADELLTIRQSIKEMQAREKEIKEGMAAGEMPKEGDFAIARFVKRNSKRFDRKAAEKELGSLARFEINGETTALMIDELIQELIES
jgi:hypothetical protein